MNLSSTARQNARCCLQLVRRSGARPGARRYATETSFMKPSNTGQPSYLSHPHLVKKDELVPGFTALEFEDRRRRLVQKLPDRSAVVSFSSPVKYMSGEIFYKYRQASDLWYLTGFQEPESAIILEKNSSSRGYRMTLFCRGKDSGKEKWEGARTDLRQAAQMFGADDARSIEDFPILFRSICTIYDNVYVDGSSQSSKRGRPKSILTFLSPKQTKAENYLDILPVSKRRSLSNELGKLRTIKSESEQAVMRAAADISSRAHVKTMRFARPGLSESSLSAHFEYISALSGAQRLAYVPVVASGANALVIHYTNNDQIVKEGELILIDAGCEYNGYASDITRTFPVNGKFTAPQRDLYSAVLSAQKACIQLCTEDKGLSLNDLHRKSCEFLRQDLAQIGFNLRTGDLERELYPHFLSHPIGIDLHESAHIERGSRLTTGMVITIEPGIYVPSSSSFPKHFHNLGIRIEDEVLVQKNSVVVLSVNAPKEISDVEGACQGLLGLDPY